MRKALIIVLIIVIGTGGYLGWDWYDKTRKQKLEPSITLYYWMDAQGGKHISDVPPPKNARNVYRDKGFKYIKPPLIVIFKNKAVEFYKETVKKLFASDKNKKK